MVDDEQKRKCIVHYDTPPGGNQQVWFLTEDGLYKILMQSRKPIARQFKRGVKNILKEIRKTGGYIATTASMTDDEIMQRALLLANKRIKEREKEIETLKTQAGQKDLIIGDMRKDTDYLNTILRSKDTVTITQIAQDYGMSERAFNQLLRDMKIQHKVGGQWILYSHLQGRGYVHSETTQYFGSDGRVPMVERKEAIGYGVVTVKL